MNSTDTYEEEGPSIESNLLIRFVIARLDELIENNCSKMSVILQALSLTCVAHDPEANKDLNELFFPSSLVKNCRAILSRVSLSTDTIHPLESLQETPLRRLSERDSRQIILSAMREVKRITANQDFEFLPIIQVLGWIALQPYPRKLQEFEAVWESGLEPAELMEAARHILWEAYRDRDRDAQYHRKLNLMTREIENNHG